MSYDSRGHDDHRAYAWLLQKRSEPASPAARGCGAKLVGDGAKSVHEREVFETAGRCRIVARVAVFDLPRAKIEAVYALDGRGQQLAAACASGEAAKVVRRPVEVADEDRPGAIGATLPD